jgi:hypothetical protein
MKISKQGSEVRTTSSNTTEGFSPYDQYKSEPRSWALTLCPWNLQVPACKCNAAVRAVFVCVCIRRATHRGDCLAGLVALAIFADM